MSVGAGAELGAARVARAGGRTRLGDEMRAMLFDGPGEPLRLGEVDLPRAGPGEVRLRVLACGICRTDLHVVDGDLAEPKRPVIPGHQIVGEIESAGAGVTGLAVGDRVGVPWLGRTCGACEYCREGRENLCAEARFTGYQIDGGFADYAVADARFVFPIPRRYSPLQAAPLLCAGLIGYRTLRMAGEARRVGLYGFGAAAHIAIQVALHEGREVYAFTRPDDERTQRFARELGAAWAGGSDAAPPVDLGAALVFAPVGELVPTALRAVARGGVVVCGGIHMSDIPSFPYALLWGERVLRSVANLTRRDGEEFFAIAPEVPIETTVHPYPLEDAARALDDLRHGRFEGAAVLDVADREEVAGRAATHGD